MDKNIKNLWKSLLKTSGTAQKALFIKYCQKLIELKNVGELTEEEAAYQMMSAIRFANLSESDEYTDIFDAAGDAEMPRASSYSQPMGQWDSKTADKIKEREWSRLLAAVDKAVKITREDDTS